MNISIESLLADAKFLVGRLKDHDAAAEGLADQTSALQKDIEARHTYQENLKELNKVAGHRPRSTLVLGIQQENCAIRSLQNENDELRRSLTDHQNALELIMTKYRHQMVQFMNNRNLLQVFPSQSTFTKDEKNDLMKTQMLMDKIYEMAAVMQKAIHIDEDEFRAQQEYISRLEAENKGLRDMLCITNGHLGSHFTSKHLENSSSDLSSTDHSHVCTSSQANLGISSTNDLQTSTKTITGAPISSDHTLPVEHDELCESTRLHSASSEETLT